MLFVLSMPAPAGAADYYVSAARGKGKKATKEKPARDLGNIISKLKPGDTVHIAGGVYRGRGKNGHYKIQVPVTILGGYDDAFKARDPWGAHRTVLSGLNTSDNADAGPRLLLELHLRHQSRAGNKHHVVVDGIIVDNRERNQYVADGKMIKRQANRKEGFKPTPGTPGIRITASPYVNVTVKNSAVINCASKTGAVVVSGGKGSKVILRNNLVANNTGDGIVLLSGFKAGHMAHMRKHLPRFVVAGNTVLFSWKISEIDEAVGNGLMVDTDLSATVKGNLFGFADLYGVNLIKINKGTPVTLAANLFAGNRWNDYKEAKAAMKVDDIEDESEHLADGSEGNVSAKIKLAAPAEWAELYAARSHDKRAKLTGGVKAAATKMNALRGLLGLARRAGPVAAKAKFWLHPLGLDDALKLGASSYGGGKFGCKKP